MTFEGWLATKGPGFLGGDLLGRVSVMDVAREAFEAGQKAEREACIAEVEDDGWGPLDGTTRSEIADAIRKRA